MVYNAEMFNRIADLAGFEFSENSNCQNFSRDELEEIADTLGIDYSNLRIGRIKQRIGEKSGFEFDQGYSSVPRGFNQEECKKIIDTLEQVDITQ